MKRYTRGNPILSVADFEKSKTDLFVVTFGREDRTKHRSFLISWQYRILDNFIKQRRVFEAEKITVEQTK